MKNVLWCFGVVVQGHEDIDDSTRLAPRVTGESTTLPFSNSRNEIARKHTCYLQVWISTSKLLVEAMLFDVLWCYQNESRVSAQYQSLI